MPLRADDLRDAARAVRDRETEAMQLDDRGHQAQPQPQPLAAPALVRTIEAFGHHLAIARRDAGTGIAHPDDDLALTVKQAKLHSPAISGELHRIVDQIGDRLE